MCRARAPLHLLGAEAFLEGLQLLGHQPAHGRARVHVVGGGEQEAFEVRGIPWRAVGDRVQDRGALRRLRVAAREAVSRGDFGDLQAVLPLGDHDLHDAHGRARRWRRLGVPQRAHEHHGAQRHDQQREDEQRARAETRESRPAAVVRSPVGTQTVLALLEQRIATGGCRYWCGCGCGCGDWYGWRLRGLLDGNLYRWYGYRWYGCRWYGLVDRSLIGGLGAEPRAAARALFPVSLAFLLGAFLGGL